MMEIIAALPYWEFGPWTPIDSLEWLQIHSFGTLVAIGLIVCLTMASWRGEKKLGVDGEEVQNFGIWLIVIGWIGAHVFNVLFYEPEKLLEDPLILFKVWGSISSYGGLFGGLIAIWLWKRLKERKGEEFDMLMWADHAAWTLTFAWFFGRLGCASVHDHIGAKAAESWPLAIDFPQYGIRHDLGLYEAMWWGIIVITVLLLDRKPRPKGFFLAVVPIMYAPVRFILDFMRVWPESSKGQVDANPFVNWWLDLLNVRPETFVEHGDMRYWGLTPAQYFSMGIFLVGLYFLWRLKDKEPMEWKQYERDENDKK
ncbi:MAG: prolipoprotein diacylglyceryl transferase [Myxococcota bacterium]